MSATHVVERIGGQEADYRKRRVTVTPPMDLAVPSWKEPLDLEWPKVPTHSEERYRRYRRYYLSSPDTNFEVDRSVLLQERTEVSHIDWTIRHLHTLVSFLQRSSPKHHEAEVSDSAEMGGFWGSYHLPLRSSESLVDVSLVRRCDEASSLYGGGAGFRERARVVFERAFARVRAVHADLLLSRLREYYSVDRISEPAMEAARFVVQQFGDAGVSIDDVSVGAEDDIFIKSGSITAMVDVDGDIALALPEEGGQRRYIDVSVDNVAQVLIAAGDEH